MSNKRRDLLKAGAGVAAAAAFPMIWIKDAHAQWNSQPEKGAKLRVLRWSRFVQGDIDQYMKNVQAFTAKYGIEVRVDSERSEEHTSELQSLTNLVCRLLLEKKKQIKKQKTMTQQ